MSPSQVRRRVEARRAAGEVQLHVVDPNPNPTPTPTPNLTPTPTLTPNPNLTLTPNPDPDPDPDPNPTLTPTPTPTPTLARCSCTWSTASTTRRKRSARRGGSSTAPSRAARGCSERGARDTRGHFLYYGDIKPYLSWLVFALRASTCSCTLREGQCGEGAHTFSLETYTAFYLP